MFFLQGASNSSIPNVLGLGILFLPFLLEKTKKIKIPKYFFLAVAVYLFYLILGLINSHPNPHIDIKFQLLAFCFFIWLINNRVKVNYLEFFFILNILVLFLYLLLFFQLVPNFWNEKTFGKEGRVLGPAITPIVYILFIYLVRGMKFDKSLAIGLLISMIYLLMTSNFMNFGIVVLLSIIIALNFKQIFKPVYILGMLVLLIVLVIYITSPLVPEMIASKLEYVFKPWEYPTVRTRIADFQQALNNENFGVFQKLFGDGFGASSNIYRENKLSPSLSRTFAFQEIDNGFYYLYHRGGWSLLVLFFISHLYLVARIKYNKAKIGFVIILLLTNLLSIHYFTYLFYLIIPFLILYPQKLVKVKTSE